MVFCLTKGRHSQGVGPSLPGMPLYNCVPNPLFNIIYIMHMWINMRRGPTGLLIIFRRPGNSIHLHGNHIHQAVISLEIGNWVLDPQRQHSGNITALKIGFTGYAACKYETIDSSRS